VSIRIQTLIVMFSLEVALAKPNKVLIKLIWWISPR